MPSEYTIDQMLQAEIEALRNIPRDNDYEKAIALILERVHDGGGVSLLREWARRGRSRITSPRPSAPQVHQLISFTLVKHSMETSGWFAPVM